MFAQMSANDDFKAPLWRYLYSAAFLKNINLSFCEDITFQDELFSFISLLEAERVDHRLKVCYKHRIFGDSITGSPQSVFKYRSYLRVYLEMMKYLGGKSLDGAALGYAVEKAELIKRLALNMLTGGRSPVIDDILGKVPRTYDFYKSLPEDRYYEEVKNRITLVTGKEPDLIDPKTFVDKLNWMKLFDSDESKSVLSDKYLVREYVSDRVGEEYLVPLLGVYDSFEDIDFKALPNRFAIKATHGSGMNLIVHNKAKLNLDEVKETIDGWLGANYAFVGLEPHYSLLKPRIIIEEYMENKNHDLYDYKLWCFDGKVKYIQFLSEREVGLKTAFYDINWNRLPFVNSSNRRLEGDAPKPENLEKLIEIAEKLSEGFNYVRVDLYHLNDGAIRFGELTFTPANGQHKWDPPEYDQIVGDMLRLDPEKVEKMRDYCIDREIEMLRKRVRMLTEAVYDFEKSEKDLLQYICSTRDDPSIQRYSELERAVFLTRENESLKAELNEIKSSTMYKVGRMVTYIPRRVKRLVMRRRNGWVKQS